MTFPSFTNSSELLAHSNEKKLFQKLLEQLGKDFQRANVDLQLSDSTNSEDVIALVKEKIYVLLLEKFDSYLNLLYAIDISEKEFEKVKSSNPVEVSIAVTFINSLCINK